jgi:hypothetical protein
MSCWKTHVLATIRAEAASESDHEISEAEWLAR